LFQSDTFDLTATLQAAVADLFTVDSVVLDPEHRGVVRLYGHFLIDSAEAYEQVYARLQAIGYTPLFRENEGRDIIVAQPGRIPEEKPRLRTAGILFAVTLLSVLFVGIFSNWDPDRALIYNVFQGLLFAVSLLAILLAHEMGHYVVARRLGVPVTLPYFIPMPLNPLGTMGALIRMKAPPRNKRHLLAVGVAGPLAGLIVALPILIVGLLLSPVQPSSVFIDPSVPNAGYLLEGNSILYLLLKFAVHGEFLPNCSPEMSRGVLDILRDALYGCSYGAGIDVTIHPIAFAGWAGLLVTGLNLIPAGQLDGGHVAYALLGRRARYLTIAMIIILTLVGVWGITQGITETLLWFIWAGLIFFLGRRTMPPLDDVTPLKPWQVVLSIFMLVLFLLTIIPVPLRAIQPGSGFQLP
jgi:membrane-associated protease RseP (regulator of RpoE activity)